MPSAVFAPKESVPALRYVPPEKVFEPASTSVPAPFLSRRPAPEIVPVLVNRFVPVLMKLFAPLSWNAFATVRLLATAFRPTPVAARFTVPVPSAVLCPIEISPALTRVPPL